MAESRPRWAFVVISAAGFAPAGCDRGPAAPPDAIVQAPAPGAAAVERRPENAASLVVERVTTKVPFPRGLEIVEGKLYVLSRGRVREAGGADPSLDDQAGTIYEVDPAIAEPFTAASGGAVSDAVRGNGRVFAAPTAPPFLLLDRTARPATADRVTDRPYCGLRYHEPTSSFYICAFSGIDKTDAPGAPDQRNFSKNLSDAVLRYDTRTGKWYEVERHDLEAGGVYPHHDPAFRGPPHGWLNGPDNCLAVGDWLYVAAKDNSLLVRYDLRAIAADPEAGPPASRVVFNERVSVRGLGEQRFYGQSTLAVHGGYLYVGYRTSSVILRVPLDKAGLPRDGAELELVAHFDPYDPATGESANLTDMAFDAHGRLYVVSAQPARLYRFTPDPSHVYDARAGRETPWADIAKLTSNPKMKSENVLVDASGRVYVTSGDAYGETYGLGGAVYRLTEAGGGGA